MEEKKITPQLVQSDGAKVCGMLNAADIEDTNNVANFLLFNIHPAPILHDVQNELGNSGS